MISLQLILLYKSIKRVISIIMRGPHVSWRNLEIWNLKWCKRDRKKKGPYVSWRNLEIWNLKWCKRNRKKKEKNQSSYFLFLYKYIEKISLFSIIMNDGLLEGVIQLVKLRTGSTLWSQFAKVSSQVTRPGVRRTAYCERPSLFGYPG